MNLRILKKRIADALLCLFAAALLLWLGDWAVWRVRVWHGGGYDTVQVSQFLLTPLKNHRVKADEQSTINQPCARSIFPHGGDDPCWWLRRHATEFQSAILRNDADENGALTPPGGRMIQRTSFTSIVAMVLRVAMAQAPGRNQTRSRRDAKPNTRKLAKNPFETAPIVPRW